MKTTIISMVAITMTLARFSNSCSVTTCPVVNPTELLTYYPDAYQVISLTGSWHQIFAMDNTASTSSQTYTEKYTVGYSETESTKTTTEWTAEAGVTFKAATVKAGYTSTVELYDSTTFTTSEEKTLEISVPAGGYANVLQRTLSSNLVWTDKVCIFSGVIDNVYDCLEPDGDYVKIYSGYKGKEKYCGECWMADFDTTTSITLGFESNCYANTQNLTQAESFCPVYSATTAARRESENINGVWYYAEVPSAMFAGIVREENTDEANATD
eukprot:CFRG2795T1